MTALILIRHGQTEANVEGRWEGWSDGTLTPSGWAQARSVAHRLAAECGRITVLYSSPLRRALQTAAVIGEALELQPVSVNDLREMDFGELDGISLDEMKAQHPTLFACWKDRADMEFKWPGGERRINFFRRIACACDCILALHPDDSVMIVSHGGTLRALLAHLLPGELNQWWEYALDNCGITRVNVDGKGNGARLLVLNDNAHLPPSNGL